MRYDLGEAKRWGASSHGDLDVLLPNIPAFADELHMSE